MSENADILDAIHASAVANGDDFRVRIQRRVSQGAALENLCVLDGAREEHFVYPETWVPAMFGGGTYFLSAHHAKTTNIRVGVGTVMVPIVGDARKPSPGDLKASARDSNWTGPSVIVWPKVVDTNPSSVSSFTAPPMAGNDNTANVGTGNQPAGALSLSQAADIARRERELSDREHRMQLDALRREANERTERLERQLAELAARKPVAEPKSDVLKDLIPVIAPIAAALMAKLTADKPSMDPVIVSLLEKQNSGAQEAVKMMSTIMASSAEANSAAMRNQIQLLATVQELALSRAGGSDEGDGMIGQLIRGFALLADNNKAAAPVIPQRTLPPAAPPQPAPSNVIALGDQGAGKKADDKSEDDGIEAETLTEAIVQMIKKRWPYDRIIEMLVENQNDEDFQADLKKAGGSVVALFAPRLADWMNDPATGAQNVNYVRGLVSALQAKGMTETTPASTPAPDQKAGA